MITTIRYRLDSQNYRKICRSIHYKSELKFLSMVFVAAVIVGALSVVDYRENGGFQVLISWLPLFGVALAFYLYMYWFFPIAYHRNPLNRNSFSPRVSRFSDDRIETVGDDGSTSIIPYTSFVKHQIGANYLALWESSLVAHMIPREAFETQEDFDLAAEYIRGKINI